MDRILLWIPMYNCEKQIIRVLKQLAGEAENYISEVIIVNNRSTDEGENAVINYLNMNQYMMPVKLLRNDENYGLGGSHKVAYQYALDNQFSYIITLHGDDQGHIADIIPWLKNGMYKRYDCLLGSRFVKGSRLEGYSKFRTFGNIVYNILFSVATGKKIFDLGAGLNMYSAKMLKNKYYFKFADDLTINYFQVLALRYYRQSFFYFPLVWSEDDQVSNVKMLNQALKTLKLLAEYLLSQKKFFSKDHRQTKRTEYRARQIYPNLNREDYKNDYLGS